MSLMGTLQPLAFRFWRSAFQLAAVQFSWISFCKRHTGVIELTCNIYGISTGAMIAGCMLRSHRPGWRWTHISPNRLIPIPITSTTKIARSNSPPTTITNTIASPTKAVVDKQTTISLLRSDSFKSSPVIWASESESVFWHCRSVIDVDQFYNSLIF